MRLGILGGTFDPIHLGHTGIALNAKQEFALDNVLLMVAKEPPHKQGVNITEAQHRYNMAALAAKEAGLEASGLELLREGPSYTVDTLLALKRKYPSASLYFILGADMLLDLPSWHNAEQVMQLTSFIAARRPTLPYNTVDAQAEVLKQRYGEQVLLLSYRPPDISSTEVRDAFLKGLPLLSMLPLPVARYALENGLYLPGETAHMLEKLKGMLLYPRFLHTVGVMLAAAELAALNGADTEKARLAALLHDCAKELPDDALISLSLSDGHTPDDVERKNTFLLHPFAGAARARLEFGVNDEEVLSAIRTHTTGSMHMSMLDEVVFLADIIEPFRKEHPGLGELRRLARQDLDLAVYRGLSNIEAYVKSQGMPLHPATRGAVLALRKKLGDCGRLPPGA